MSNTPLPEPGVNGWAYTPSQLHAHAAAVTAEKDAEIAGLREEAVSLRAERDNARADRDALRVQVAALTKLVDASEGGTDVDGVNWFDLRDAARKGEA